MGLDFDYGVVNMKDVKVQFSENGRRPILTGFMIPSKFGEEVFINTKRALKSWQMRFKLNDNVFKYWHPHEVFQRLSEKCPNDQVRYAIERVTKKDGTKCKPRMLAFTNPNQPLIEVNKLLEILEKNQTDYKDGQPVDPSYSDGFIRSSHKPRNLQRNYLKNTNDVFENRYYIDTPVDGFGKPHAYVGLYREICSNGAIGFAPAFRSEITVGKKNDSVAFAIERMLNTFNNEEGFIGIREMFEAATESWASVRECMTLHNMVIKTYQKGGLKKSAGKLVIGERKNTIEDVSITPIMNKFMELTGNLNSIYATANIDSISEKKQRALPASCKVYDLLNFASELATHHAMPSGARQLQAYIGDMLSDEYDLHGTGTKFNNYTDFFIGNKETASALASIA